MSHVELRRLAAGLVALLTWAGAAGAAEAVLSLLRGEVLVARAGSGEFRPVAMGESLDPGDRLRTGANGWASIALSDGSRLVVTAKSEFTLRGLDGKRRDGDFDLSGGMLRASVTRKPGEPANYRFRTVTATAGIRGTDFILLNNGPANVYFGNEGKVAVSGAAGPDQALTADTVVETTRGLAPIRPIALAPDSALKQVSEVMNRVTEAPPESWAETERLPDILARWNINYSHYLSDAGRRDEALHALQLAVDLASDPDTLADARLELAAVHGRDPDGIELALLDYAPLLELPLDAPQRETALFMTAKALFQLDRRQEARVRLHQYLREYGNGRYGRSGNTLLNLMK